MNPKLCMLMMKLSVCFQGERGPPQSREAWAKGGAGGPGPVPGQPPHAHFNRGPPAVDEVRYSILSIQVY